MAGAGYKLFNTGDVLLASEVNTYLMQQTVMVFANASARTTALSGVLAEGMVSYLQDTNVVEIYNGSAWASLDDPNAIQNTIVDAKGDLISATADNTPARLASSGNNGDVLTIDTSTSTGLKWAAPAGGGGGKVLQVVQDVTTTGETSTSTSYVATNLSQAITPSANTSKVLVMADLNTGLFRDVASSSATFELRRGSTQIATETIAHNFAISGYSKFTVGTTICFLDSPNTTSSTTYDIRMKVTNGTNNETVYLSEGSHTSSLTLLEIGA